jgi:hypothetical protein
MPHFWMTYRDTGRSVGVVIMDAPSLIQAGLKVIRADSGECGQRFRSIADSDSDRSRTAFR